MRPAIAYIRISTVKQGRSALGSEAQQEALQRFAEAEGYSWRPLRMLRAGNAVMTTALPWPRRSKGLVGTKRPSSWRSSTGSAATFTTFPA